MRANKILSLWNGGRISPFVKLGQISMINSRFECRKDLWLSKNSALKFSHFMTLVVPYPHTFGFLGYSLWELREENVRRNLELWALSFTCCFIFFLCVCTQCLRKRLLFLNNCVTLMFSEILQLQIFFTHFLHDRRLLN